MDMEKKRIPNFTITEKECLMRIIMEKYAHKLEDKKTNRTSIQEKNKIWELIEEEFNNKAPIQCYRSSEQLRRLYENKKKELRKKMAEHKKETYLTGGGPPPADIKVDPIDECLLQIINEKSVGGFGSHFDSDCLEEPIPQRTVDSSSHSPLWFAENDVTVEEIIVNSPIDCSKTSDNKKRRISAEPSLHLVDEDQNYQRCPPWNMKNSLNPKLKSRDKVEIVPGTDREQEQWDIPSTSQLQPTEEGYSSNSKTPKISRRRPTSGIRALSSSHIADKYNILLDKRLVLVSKQIEKSVEEQNSLREEHKQKMRVLKQQEENLILEKEEKKLKIEMLRIDLRTKRQLFSSGIGNFPE